MFICSDKVLTLEMLALSSHHGGNVTLISTCWIPNFSESISNYPLEMKGVSCDKLKR